MKTVRVTVRRKIHKAGSIVVGSRLVTCTVHNLSAAGAAISVRHSATLPDAFVLILDWNTGGAHAESSGGGVIA